MADREDAGAREEPVSRRRLLSKLARAGTAGAGAAVLGGSVLAEPAMAGSDGDVVLGLDGQVAAGTTGVQSNANVALRGQSINNSGTGVSGLGALNGVEGHSPSNSGSGVYGENVGTGYGVAGRSLDGIAGVLGDTHGGQGVRGIATSGTGVFGEATAITGGTTYGVQGRSWSAAGAGVSAESAASGGTALKVSGKARFSHSGKATIASGAISVTVVAKDLTKESFILATLQKNVAGDTWIKAAVPNVAGHSFTIFLNGPTPVAMPVAWFVVN